MSPATNALVLLLIGTLVAGCLAPERPSASDTGSNATADVLAASFPLFSHITEEAGLHEFRHETGAFGDKWFPETMGSGGGFVDYDVDGRPDILLVGGGVWPGRGAGEVQPLRLYRNLGDGTFDERTREAGLGDLRAFGMGTTVADYDNDGDPDIFFTTLNENLLLRNDGGVFADITEQAGISGTEEWSTAALFFDANRDAYLDLFVGNYVAWSPEQDIFCTLNGQDKSYFTPELCEGIEPRFYRNEGDGTFLERSADVGIRPSPGKALGVAMTDYNRDGWIDLAVANDQQPDLLFENRGDGTFAEVGILSGIAFNEEGRAHAGMGIDSGVVDESGEETIFVGNFSEEMTSVFRHFRNGIFLDRAAVSLIGFPSQLMLTFGLFLFDADLDGDLDLFAANGHVQEDIEQVRDNIGYRMVPQLYLNRGDGRFDVKEPSSTGEDPLATPIVARGSAYSDIDGDGDLDVLVTENGGPAHLWRNNLMEILGAEAPGTLHVKLEGRRSNRNGIGATVGASAGETYQQRLVSSGSSYLSHSESAVVLGLGPNQLVDTLWVYWPSNYVSRFLDVAAGQVVRIVEGDDILYLEAAFVSTELEHAP
jgi:hypothetical protein